MNKRVLTRLVLSDSIKHSHVLVAAQITPKLRTYTRKTEVSEKVLVANDHVLIQYISNT